MTIKEVYEKYKHFDKFFCDEAFLDSMQTHLSNVGRKTVFSGGYMQSLFDDVVREIPSADDYETNCRDVWPQRWALLKVKVEKFTSTSPTCDYATALRVLEAYRADGHASTDSLNFIENWINQRLNASTPLCPGCGGVLISQEPFCPNINCDL